MTCTVRMSNKAVRRRGLVLIELLIVISLMALLMGVGMISFGAMWGNLKFRHQAQELVDVFQMAQDASAQSNRRYAVVLDFPNNEFRLREYAATDFETLSEGEAVIRTGYFTENFQLDYVLFDDLDDTRDDEVLYDARFLAGRTGWQYGGKVVIRDGDGNPWTILISRIASPVQLVEGDVSFLMPRGQNELFF